MPELPEVETLRRELSVAIKGKTIKSAEIKWPKMVKPLAPAEFAKKIKGKKIIAVNRRAKVLILDLNDNNYLVIHLKLTGQFIFSRFAPRQARGKNKPRLVFGGHPQKGGTQNLPNKFTHIIITFTDGSKLFFNDLRKFGWMRIVDQRSVDQLISEYGVEPLSKEFNLKKFQEILKRYPNRKIKQILMDQSLIAGVGNIYCDESCFGGRILPTRIVNTLKEKEIKSLYRYLPKILRFAIAKKGTSANTFIQLDGKPGGMEPYLKVYGRKGEKCKRCGDKIMRIKLNGRGTHFCQNCQK
ncbi:MAG TPA: DNA-formamidopyrimidine glycosylase [Patescibacteria group bacterium]|nr:DNA-formamidopyrimidine glycosylase [Patescibacteria group bacterium]